MSRKPPMDCEMLSKEDQHEITELPVIVGHRAPAPIEFPIVKTFNPPDYTLKPMSTVLRQVHGCCIEIPHGINERRERKPEIRPSPNS